MRSRKDRLKKRNRKSKSKVKLKVAFFIICLLFFLTAGTLYFNKYYKIESKAEAEKTKIKTVAKTKTKSNAKKSKATGGGVKKKKAKKKSDDIEKGIPHNMEFTFFETLSKSENYISDDPPNAEKKTGSKIKKNKLSRARTAKTDYNSKHIIQASSFKDRSRAEKARKKLVSKGYQAIIYSAKANNKKIWHKVRIIGGFKDKESALKLISKLKKEEKINALILSANDKK